MTKVLITNGFLRKTLVAVRALGAIGLTVHAADSRRPNPSAWSKWCARSLVYPDPQAQPERFRDWLNRTLTDGQYDLFLPMDDDTMDIAVEMQQELSRMTNVLLPDRFLYRQMRDKSTAAARADAAGFLVPDTFVPETEDDLTAIASALAYPVVLKPRSSSGSRGFRVIDSADDLRAQYNQLAGTYERPMIQSKVPLGPRIDVCLLLGSDQELLAGFVQREVRHFPEPYGPSTVQESIHNEALLAKCTAFAQDTGWTGPIEFEFMRDPTTHRLYFMEANPRFWNSLALAHAAGVPFIELLYRYAINGAEKPVTSYSAGIRCRNLLPTDTLCFLTSPNRFQFDPPFFAWGRRGGGDDILSWSDPGPTFGFAASLVRFALQRGALRSAFKR